MLEGGHFWRPPPPTFDLIDKKGEAMCRLGRPEVKRFDFTAQLGENCVDRLRLTSGRSMNGKPSSIDG